MRSQRELGRGGMAVVHLARQTDLDRLVAPKKKRNAVGSEDPRDRRPLSCGNRGWQGSLSHSNIVMVHDFFEWRGRPTSPWSTSPGIAAAGVLARLWHRSPACSRTSSPACRRATRTASSTATSSPTTSWSRADGRVKLVDFGVAKPRSAPTASTGDGHDGRHARLHGARAGQGAVRPADRPLLGRLHGVRDAPRPHALRRFREPDRGHASPRERADPARERREPEHRPGRVELDRRPHRPRTRPSHPDRRAGAGSRSRTSRSRCWARAGSATDA